MKHLLLLLAALFPHAATAQSIFPPKISANRRYFAILGPVFFWTIACFLGPHSGAATPPNATNTILSRCDQPFVFGFGSWEKARTNFPVRPDGIHLSTKDGKGGAGVAGIRLNLDEFKDYTPALTLAVGAGNEAQTVTLELQDGDGTGHSYRFDLRALKPGPARKITADFGASLGEPQTVVKPGTIPGLDSVVNWLIIGDWSGHAVHVVLSGIELAPPTDALQAERAKLRDLKAREAANARREAEAREQARRKLLESGAPHPADGPEVKHVCAVAPDVLAVTMQAGRFVGNQLLPYVAEPGDSIEPVTKEGAAWREVEDGKIVEHFPKALYRMVNQRRTQVGQMCPDGKQVFIEGRTAGQVLDETIVDLPAAYRIESAADPAYAKPVAPLAVFRKGKPNGSSQPLPFRYTISLRLPSPLKEGATYAIRFHGVNTAKETVAYTHLPRTVRSLAIHAIQTGYRPDDPYKRAYLSFWMGVDAEGKHGSCTHTPGAFELLDAAGRTVFTGKPELAKAGGAEEQISIHEKADYTKAAVHRLDFSDFKTPGEYRVFVPGVGVSGAFRLARDVWEQPFRAAMLGIFTQRQGIELGPPATAYRRARTFHPDDGVQFYQMSIPVQGGQEAGEGGNAGRGGNLSELAKAGPLERVTGVWGGYQDAGDWDTLGHHLSASYDLLGLFDLNRAACERAKLSLPAAEAANNLPDLLDEALWQMPCWRRLQLPDGGVRGGYGYGWGCPRGLTSSMIRSAGVYAPEPATTLHFAAVAARAARVLRAYDQKLSAEYLDAARRAWTWAEIRLFGDFLVIFHWAG